MPCLLVSGCDHVRCRLTFAFLHTPGLSFTRFSARLRQIPDELSAVPAAWSLDCTLHLVPTTDLPLYICSWLRADVGREHMRGLPDTHHLLQHLSAAIPAAAGTQTAVAAASGA